MGKFLVLHTLRSPTAPDEASPLAQKVKASSTLDAYWVGSWGQLDKEGKITKIYCEWDAKDVESIRKVLAKVPELPVDGIYPLLKIDSESYR